MNRRHLLTAAAASVMLPAAAKAKRDTVMVAPSTNPDADLLALAERFIQHERAMHDWPCDAAPGTLEEEVQEVEQRQMFDVQHALTLQLGMLHATTAEGVAGRARCLAIHNSHGGFSMDYPDTVTGMLVHYVMRDAAALGGSPVAIPAPPSPDSELMEACAAFDALERASLTTFHNHEAGSSEEKAADAERERLSEAQEPLVNRMCELQALTREGMAARAHSLALWDAELLKDGIGDTGTCLTAAIVRDLLAGKVMA